MSKADVIFKNLHVIHQRISDAALKSGRNAKDITLVAVTKYVDVALTRQLILAGCKVLGESRPQQLWAKCDALADLDVSWHLIGHLQRNKLKRTLPLIHLMHSVDSVRILAAINEFARSRGVSSNVLLEVNISGDPNKHGFLSGDMPPLIDQLDQYANIQFKGLMGMASLHGGIEQARRDFSALQELHQNLQVQRPPNSFPHLSMGMSRDFEQAILAGSTMVRVGSALFEGIET